jgi:hypothetical protein
LAVLGVGVGVTPFCGGEAAMGGTCCAGAGGAGAGVAVGSGLWAGPVDCVFFFSLELCIALVWTDGITFFGFFRFFLAFFAAIFFPNETKRGKAAGPSEASRAEWREEKKLLQKKQEKTEKNRKKPPRFRRAQASAPRVGGWPAVCRIAA